MCLNLKFNVTPLNLTTIFPDDIHRGIHQRSNFQHVTIRLTDFDFLGIQLADLPLQPLQPPLNPAGPPEHHPRLHLDAQEDVAGMSRKVRELVYYAGESVTADLVQGRKQHGFLQLASPVVLHRRPAIPRRQPTHMPRLDAPLMKGHVYFKPLTPAGPEKLLGKTHTQPLTALKQIQDASLSSGGFNLRGAVILRSRHIFCFSKHGGLCAAVHWRRCLPKSIQIQPDRAQPGEKREEKNTRKSRGKYK